MRYVIDGNEIKKNKDSKTYCPIYRCASCGFEWKANHKKKIDISNATLEMIPFLVAVPCQHCKAEHPQGLGVAYLIAAEMEDE